MPLEIATFWLVLALVILHIIYLILYLVKGHSCECKNVTSAFVGSKPQYYTKDQILLLWKNTNCPLELSDSNINLMLRMPHYQAWRYLQALSKPSRNTCGMGINTVKYTDTQIGELFSTWIEQTGNSDFSDLNRAIANAEKSNVPFAKFKNNAFKMLIETENFRNKNLY